MRSIICYPYIAMMVILVLSGCMSSRAVQTPTLTIMPSVSSTPILLSPTPLPDPTQSKTPTPFASLEPERAHRTLEILLREPIDCGAPCFWMIMPGQTSLEEARNIFAKLRLNLKFTLAESNRKFYAVDYDFDNGLSITVIITIQNDLVENLRVHISPEKQNTGMTRGWLTYSPETLINRYGVPSRVDFFFGGAVANPSYAMDLYFNDLDLIIEYYSYDLGPDMQICPLTDQMDSVRIWMGKNPINPPPDAVVLEKATSLNMEQFSKLITGDPSKACFNLKPEMFR
jgi:hypothetical protein